ncbi:hypothetical protein V500_11048 [Pseudogymnoascus sp. VKM F-4518 (FW-2643)]|nr:hypothetical protein V500_11048 [Pseudogymnoascus sp. VKM F-4518 (FW-2643)]
MSLATTLLLPVRGAQALFALIVMALMADSVAHFWDPPSEVSEVYINLIFSVWALLNLAYLVIAPIAFPKAANKWAILVIETLTMILWIASFASLAAFSSQYCYYNDPRMREKKCDEFMAAVVFGALSWVLFVGTTILAALHCWRTRGGNIEPTYIGA